MSINKTSLIGGIVIAMVFSIAVTGVVSAWPQNIPPYDECHAVIIGISDYMGQTEYDDPYGGAVSDATKFYNELRETWGWFAPIALITDSDATQDTIDATLDTVFSNMGENDLAIVYWNGHAAQFPDTAPLDEADGLDGGFATYDGWIYTDDELKVRLGNINADQTIVILDGCHVGEWEDELDTPGIVGVMACEKPEVAWLYEYTAPYPFSNFGYAFSHYMNKHPDVNGDGVITIEEVFGYASPRTTWSCDQYGDSQHPIIVDNVPGDVAYLDSWG
jgi:hypothetical protein